MTKTNNDRRPGTRCQTTKGRHPPLESGLSAGGRAAFLSGVPA